MCNVIIGIVVLVIGVILVGGMVSVLIGIYLFEFVIGKIWFILCGVYEVLFGILLIVFGYVGYLVLVVYFDWGFLLVVGVLVLLVMSIFYIVKVIEFVLV